MSFFTLTTISQYQLCKIAHIRAIITQAYDKFVYILYALLSSLLGTKTYRKIKFANPKTVFCIVNFILLDLEQYIGEGRRGNGQAVESTFRNPEGRGSIPRLSSRRSLLISIEHAELLCSTPSLVLCCVWLDDERVVAKHCGRAKRSRISDTHQLRWSLQFRYINNQSLLFIIYR